MNSMAGRCFRDFDCNFKRCLKQKKTPRLTTSRDSVVLDFNPNLRLPVPRQGEAGVAAVAVAGAAGGGNSSPTRQAKPGITSSPLSVSFSFNLATEPSAR